MSIRAILNGLGDLDLDEVRDEEERLERALIVVRAVRAELEARVVVERAEPVLAAAEAVVAAAARASLTVDQGRRTAPHGDPFRHVAADEPIEQDEPADPTVEPPRGQRFTTSSPDVVEPEPEPEPEPESVEPVEQDDEPPAPATSSSQADPAPAAPGELITPRELEDLPRTSAGGLDLNVGHPAERAARRDRALLAVYRANAGRWLRNIDVATILGIDPATVGAGARRLVDGGSLEHNGKGGAWGRYRAPLDGAHPANAVAAGDEIDAYRGEPVGNTRLADDLARDRSATLEQATATIRRALEPPRPAGLVGDAPAGDEFEQRPAPAPGPRPAVNGALRRQLAAEERERRRLALAAQADPTDGRQTRLASSNGSRSKPDPDRDATLEGRVLQCLGYQPGTISDVANRLRIPDDQRAALALAVAKLVDEGDVKVDRSRPGPRWYEAA